MVDLLSDDIADPKPRSIFFRLDLQRALLAFGLALGAIVLTLGFTFGWPWKQDNILADDGFGRDTRVGSILVMPLVGDSCRQFAFDNDSGATTERAPESCAVIEERERKAAKKESHVQEISEKFRK
jgi:hypothetical protein